MTAQRYWPVVYFAHIREGATYLAPEFVAAVETNGGYVVACWHRPFYSEEEAQEKARELAAAYEPAGAREPAKTGIQ